MKNGQPFLSATLGGAGRAGVSPVITVSTALLFRPDAASGPEAALFLAAFENCPEGIALVQSARILHSNAAFARLFGYFSPEEVEGSSLAKLLPASHRCAQNPKPREINSRNCGYPGCQFQGVLKDGSHRLMESSCVEFESGGEQFLLLTARDISHRERRRVFRDSEKRYRAIFDAAAIGIVQCTMDGRVVETNPAVERMLGYTREELRGMHFRDFTHPEDVQTDLDLFDEIVRGARDHYQIEIRYVRKDQSYGWVELTVSLIRGPAGEPQFTLGIAADVTERKAAERQLREAQKMEAIGRLVGGVAHDFNNLLTAVTLYADLLAAGLEPGNRLQHHVDEIRLASEQGATLIQHLLAMVRRQPVEPRIVDVNDAIRGMGSMLGRLIGENIELRTKLADRLPSVRIDPVQLQQVILNLVLNARDAMPDGGSIEIVTRDCQQLCNLQRLGESMPSCCVAVSVCDNGSGMDAETRSHLFEPFFTTKLPGQGNGLGLATVRAITKEAGGRIQVDSEPGKGTRVTLLLPYADECIAQPDKPVKVPVQGGQETILVVEDDAQVRRSVERVLRKYGYDVLVCANGAEALNLLQNNSRPVQLVITDLVLPGISGREVAQRLHNLRPDLQVIVTSGFQQAPTSEGEGPIVVFRKPFTGDLLARKVRELLDAGSGEVPEKKG